MTAIESLVEDPTFGLFPLVSVVELFVTSYQPHYILQSGRYKELCI